MPKRDPSLRSAPFAKSLRAGRMTSAFVRRGSKSPITGDSSSVGHHSALVTYYWLFWLAGVLEGYFVDAAEV
jgi:hypothetical protein